MSRGLRGTAKAASEIHHTFRCICFVSSFVAVLDAATPAAAPRLARFVLLRNVLVLVGSQLTTWCVALAWAVIVPRTIGPARWELYLGVASGGILTVVIGLGIRPLFVREIAVDRTRGSPVIGAAMTLRLLISLCRSSRP